MFIDPQHSLVANTLPRCLKPATVKPESISSMRLRDLTIPTPSYCNAILTAASRRSEPAGKQPGFHTDFFFFFFYIHFSPRGRIGQKAQVAYI